MPGLIRGNSNLGDSCFVGRRRPTEGGDERDDGLYVFWNGCHKKLTVHLHRSTVKAAHDGPALAVDGHPAYVDAKNPGICFAHTG